MNQENGPIGHDWIKLVQAAEIIGVYPGTLYRWWRFGQLAEGACVKVDNTLYFYRDELERIRIKKKPIKVQE